MILNLRLTTRLRSPVKRGESYKPILHHVKRFYAIGASKSTEEMTARRMDDRGIADGHAASTSKSPSAGDKAYASTLLLPQTAFPIWIEPRSTREQFQQRTSEEIYKWQVYTTPRSNSDGLTPGLARKLERTNFHFT